MRRIFRSNAPTPERSPVRRLLLWATLPAWLPVLVALPLLPGLPTAALALVRAAWCVSKREWKLAAGAGLLFLVSLLPGHGLLMFVVLGALDPEPQN